MRRVCIPLLVGVPPRTKPGGHIERYALVLLIVTY